MSDRPLKMSFRTFPLDILSFVFYFSIGTTLAFREIRVEFLAALFLLLVSSHYRVIITAIKKTIPARPWVAFLAVYIIISLFFVASPRQQLFAMLATGLVISFLLIDDIGRQLDTFILAIIAKCLVIYLNAAMFGIDSIACQDCSTSPYSFFSKRLFGLSFSPNQHALTLFFGIYIALVRWRITNQMAYIYVAIFLSGNALLTQSSILLPTIILILFAVTNETKIGQKIQPKLIILITVLIYVLISHIKIPTDISALGSVVSTILSPGYISTHFFYEVKSNYLYYILHDMTLIEFLGGRYNYPFDATPHNFILDATIRYGQSGLIGSVALTIYVIHRFLLCPRCLHTFFQSLLIIISINYDMISSLYIYSLLIISMRHRIKTCDTLKNSG